MEYVRIKSSLNNEFTGCKHAYIGDNIPSAIQRFLREYPEHKSCTLVLEVIDDCDDKYRAWSARSAGCVHAF